MNKLPARNQQGFALFFVLSAIAISVPLLMLFSVISSSQSKQAVHFHERITTETIAWSGIQAAIARLQGNGGAQFFSGSLSGGDYSVSIQPLGSGMATQSIYHIFSQGTRGQFTYTFLVTCEQFPKNLLNPAEPNLVIPRDFWGTSESFDISQAFDCNAMVNLRGADTMQWLSATLYELGQNPTVYDSVLSAKAGRLPPEVAAKWTEAVQVLVQEKACIAP